MYVLRCAAIAVDNVSVPEREQLLQFRAEFFTSAHSVALCSRGGQAEGSVSCGDKLVLPRCYATCMRSGLICLTATSSLRHLACHRNAKGA